jgi:hypothetical protein
LSRIADERVPAFNVGLASVQRAPRLLRLPEAGVAPALDTQPVVYLDALFEAPGVDDRLDGAAMPTLAETRVVDPTTYAGALEDALDLMRELAAVHAGSRQAVFANAQAVLEQVRSNRELLDEARRSLMQG